MNAQPQTNIRMTPEKYLEFERASEHRHEYYDGEIFAMVGASLNHNRINRNIIQRLENQLEGSSCEAFISDMRVKVDKLDKYTYPDIVIVCGDIKLEDDKFDTLLNPIVIIEILSDSTEAYDRGAKFQHYRLVPSLQEYILVSQNSYLVERYVRSDEGSWRYFAYENMEHTMEIESVKCSLLLSDIYYRVKFQDS
ncbi:MAG: Uma2 family endonuclease [Thermodesulfobacteriota bacterium]|nr:Uma2 family endonuclease [Thermodesulfobacteriota bacterium]